MAVYTRPIIASLLQSGLTGTLGYTVLAVGGATLVARTTAGIAEDGASAIYSADVANWDVAWAGRIVWDAGAGTLAREDFVAYTPQTGDSFARLGAPATTTIAADVATRSTYAGADTPGTSTLLGRLASALTIAGGKVAATLASGDDADAASVKTTLGVAGAGLTALGDARLAHLDADVSSRSTYAGSDTAGTTALLARLTSGRAVNLDNLDVPVSTRLAASAYVAPPDAPTIVAAVFGHAVDGGTFDQAIAAIAREAAGDVAESLDHTVTTIGKFLVQGVTPPGLTSTNSAAGRTVTVH